jgi:hypothetical protein
LINCQIFAPLQSEDVVTTSQAIVVGTKEVSQTSSEGIRQTTQSSSPNIEDEKWVENNLNFRTPLPIVPTFGTLESITKEGWLVLSGRKKMVNEPYKLVKAVTVEIHLTII